MIEAAQFVEAARERGFDWYAGVPCSFLTSFINYVLQDDSLHYVSAANEGDAVALIAGVALGGARLGAALGSQPRRGIAMMQNSGLGNAVSPLTSLTWTFRLPQLLIVTWRGQPGVHDELQHALMGPITPQMLETMEIPWELFPTEVEQIGPALDRAIEYMDSTGRPYALVMQKGSVAPYELKKTGLSGVRVRAPAARVERIEGTRVTRRDALEKVIAHTPKETTVVLASTGFGGRELYALDDRDNQLYLVGSMGCVTPMALGLALSRPDLHVVALDGDDIGVIDRLFNAQDVDGPRFARLSIATGTSADLPRPKITPEDVCAPATPHRRLLMLLLNPGPVTLSEHVRKSLLQTDLCHHEPEFFDLQDEVHRCLVAAYELDPATWSAVLMTGSGTAAVESMIAGLVPEGGRLLVVENGVYGDRIAQIAAQYGIEHEVLKYEWMQAPVVDDVVAGLDAGAFTNVAIIHHETTTGRLNDIAALSKACAAFVIARRDWLAKAASRTYYLGIARLAKLQDARNTPFTPSVHAYTRWSRRCTSSRKKAAGACVTPVTRRSRNRCARGWWRWASKARCRRSSRRSCCGRTGCRRASPMKRCTMR